MSDAQPGNQTGMKNVRHLKTGFAPIAAPDARILVLGSMPGERSLQMQQYYAHPANYFWKFMCRALMLHENTTYGIRTRAMKKAGVALWDVLKHCERQGSLDSDIVRHSEQANDILSFLDRHRHIIRICFNGQKAAAAFRRHILKAAPELVTRFEMLTMPSTSPANASQSVADKYAVWLEAVWKTPICRDG